MTDTMKAALERTKCALTRHLEDLMDEIDQAEGRISSRRLLDGVHKTVETLAMFGPITEVADGEQSPKATKVMETAE